MREKTFWILLGTICALWVAALAAKQFHHEHLGLALCLLGAAVAVGLFAYEWRRPLVLR